MIDGQLQITARADYRLDGGRQIKICDLPLISFQWALSLMEGHVVNSGLTAPETKVVLMYANEPRVQVEGEMMYTDTLYMIGSELELGEIGAGKIHKAV
jgi:hypothetical protein